MLIGRDARAVHRQRWISITDPKVTEDLIVRPILLDDVNDVANGVAAAGELQVLFFCEHAIADHNGARKSRQVVLCVRQIHAGKRPVKKRRDVGVRAAGALLGSGCMKRGALWRNIGPGAFAFRGRDQQFAIHNGKRCREPFRRNKP